MPAPYNACTDLLDDAIAQGSGEHIAVVTRERSFTYSDVLAEVEGLAAGLRAAGLVPEQRIALVLLDGPELIAAFLAGLRIGAVPVLVNPLLPARDIATIVAASRATTLVLSGTKGDVAAVVADAAPDLATVIITGSPSWDALVAGGRGQSSDPYPTWDESPGFWLCTSGSTGAPKLAMHRHVDLRVTADTYGREVLGVRADDRCYSVGPMFHAYGLGNSLTFPFAARATAILEATRPPTPALVGEILRTHRPTLFFCIPTFYAALVASDLADDTFASVRIAVSAAEPLPADTFHRFRERFGVEILDGIGSTELAHIFLSNRPGAARPGTSGQPVTGYDVSLLDDEGRAVPPDTPGHLHVGGPSMATGYWCNTEANQRVFLGDRMRAGDMYQRSEDGWYTYLGRSDDMLRVGGEWVSPAEVEALLVTHAGVFEAAVVAGRDKEGVTRVVAYVVPATDTALDVGELEVLCKAELAGYKRPKQFIVVDDLPKTATGKIQRYKLRTR